jgi:hypothetical protein
MKWFGPPAPLFATPHHVTLLLGPLELERQVGCPEAFAFFPSYVTCPLTVIKPALQAGVFKPYHATPAAGEEKYLTGVLRHE